MCVFVTCSSGYSCYSAAGFHMNVTAVWPSTYMCNGDLDFPLLASMMSALRHYLFCFINELCYVKVLLSKPY